MEYQKPINLLDNTSNQPSKFRTKNWVEINNHARGICNTNSQMKFKTSMLKSSLCDYSDAIYTCECKYNCYLEQEQMLQQQPQTSNI